MGNDMGEEIRYISLFSGVEACSVAWYHMKNWQAVAFAEFDAFPSAVLKYQFPHVPNVGDVTKHEWKQYKGKCELIVGGSPCQSFSVAGKRLGLDDPRGNLALHFLRIVEEIRPTWFIFENVPGLLSSDNGRDFAAFLREVENIGYGCAYRVLDAQYFGVPQRRRRLFVVGHIDGDYRRAASVLFEPEGLSGNTPKSYKERQDASATIGSGTSERGRYWNGGGITNTFTARGDSQRMPDKDHFHGVITKLPSGIDLFNQEETGEVHVPLRTAQGHGAPAVLVDQKPWRMAKAPMSKDDFARWEESEAHPTLNTFANHGENRLQSAVTVETKTVYENHGQDSRIKEVNVSPTIPARAGTGGNNLPLVNHVEAIPIHDQATRFKGKRGDNNDGKGNGFGIGNDGDPSNTLTRNDRHAVAINEGVNMVVRRLTPTECERLQGFPDGWTQIPWKGKAKEDCPDGPRFKAMGNSMAVPVMRWIGEGIELVNRIPKTEVPKVQELGWL